jgi:hypothetical protein
MYIALQLVVNAVSVPDTFVCTDSFLCSETVKLVFGNQKFMIFLQQTYWHLPLSVVYQSDCYASFPGKPTPTVVNKSIHTVFLFCSISYIQDQMLMFHCHTVLVTVLTGTTQSKIRKTVNIGLTGIIG